MDALQIQRGRVADFLLQHNYHLTALEFHQELLLEGNAVEVPRLAEFTDSIAEPAVQDDEAAPTAEQLGLTVAEAEHLDRVVHQYLTKRGFSTAALAMVEQVPKLAMPYGDELELVNMLRGAARSEAMPEVDLSAPHDPRISSDAMIRSLKTENEALQARIAKFVSQIDITTHSATAMHSQAALDDATQDFIDVFAEQLPEVIPSVLINKREPLVPMLLCIITLHGSHAKRDELTKLLFNLIKRPTAEQRHLIVDGCINLAKNIANSDRIETELIPQIWEQITHKHWERRALVAQSIGSLSPYVKPYLRTSLLLSIAKQMVDEERDEQVRLVVAENIVRLVGFFDDTEKIRDCLDILRRLLRDSDQKVLDIAHESLLPGLCNWALRQKAVVTELAPVVLQWVENASNKFQQRSGDPTDFCHVLRVFSGLISPLHFEVIRTAPWVEPGMDDNQLQDLFNDFMDSGEEKVWHAWDWLMNAVPRLMSVAPPRGSPSGRMVGQALANIFHKVNKVMGPLYTKDVLHPNFNLMLSHRDEATQAGVEMAQSQRGRLFPLYVSGVVACLGTKELNECLQATISDVALNANGWVGDGSGVLMETVQDQCEAGRTKIVMDVLKGMVADPAGTIRVLVANLLDVCVPLTDQDELADIVAPILTLANDGNEEVKLAAVNALCTIVTKVGDGDPEMINKIGAQLQTLVNHGSRDLALEMVKTFTRIIPSAPDAIRNIFLLESLLNITEQNATNKMLPRRQEFAGALFEAFRAFDSVYLSPDQVSNYLAPAYELLKSDPELLDTFATELIATKLAEIEPAEEQKEKKSTSSWNLTNFGGKLERSLKKKVGMTSPTGNPGNPF